MDDDVLHQLRGAAVQQVFHLFSVIVLGKLVDDLHAEFFRQFAGCCIFRADLCGQQGKL